MNYIDAIQQYCVSNNLPFYNKSFEFSIRCPFCGDSAKNKQHTHLYASKYILPDYPQPVFYCMRCGESGTIKKLLRQLKISASKVEIEVPTISSENIRENIYFERNNKRQDKIEYVKQRLNLQELPKWIDDTIVDSFKIPEKRNLERMLNYDFVGFTSYRKSRVNCRNIKSNNIRYITLSKDFKKDHYIVQPKDIKLLQKGTIILAEGVFSLLRGYFTLKQLEYIGDSDQIILVASWSKSSLISAYQFVTDLFGIIDWRLIILADKDFNYHTFPYKSTILYNRDNLDFGNDCKRIKEIKLNKGVLI